LAFFTTDAALTPDALSVVLRQVTGRTFNRLSVDGDRSPNDSVIMLASGTGGAPLIQGPESRGFSAFYSAVLEAGSSLARMIAADGEGATKLVEIRVKGADTFDSANRVARAIANSPLVKTALYGADPNWGRIICAAGYSGAPVEPDKIDIYFGSLLAVKSGVDAGSDRLKLAGELKKNEITVTVDLNQGPHECSFWTCDFSYDYIRINADYHT
ncbi:MAG TPA: bifunctional ornithine acetyltransferase/N-acetylglutamate synthase, partial [archaeon]|nr:bifunctional ornithine acetyltransferase/N-acetylglutamate synthase [archaeon]